MKTDARRARVEIKGMHQITRIFRVSVKNTDNSETQWGRFFGSFLREWSGYHSIARIKRKQA